MKLPTKVVQHILNIKNYSTFRPMDYKRCYEILQLKGDCDQEKLRKAYIRLVKIYHPDSGTTQASAEKFQEIDEAFKILCSKLSKEKFEADQKEVEEQDIKHTVPQHRQYLSFDGYGVGNPFQREKQYMKQRAIIASQNVFKHRAEKAATEENALMKKKSLQHNIKTKYGLDRLVEDLIQESMSKGEFNKLSGAGKPLKDKSHRNPYVDFITHKLNEVLIDNGFTPEWIRLNKEIREELGVIRNDLQQERKRLKKFPLDEEESHHWENFIKKYESVIKELNLKIDKFNLVVPILNKQIFRIDLAAEAQKVLMNGEYSKGDLKRQKNINENESKPKPHSFFELIENVFFK